MDVLRRCSQDFSVPEEWTKAKTLKFLRLYSSERLLWDLSHKHNKVKRKVHEAWKRISASLDSTLIVELKKRKKNLVTRYRSLVKKKETDSEAGYDEDICQPVWYAFEIMDNFFGSSRHEDPLKIEAEMQENNKLQTKEGIIKKQEIEVVDQNLQLDNETRNYNSDNESTQTIETNRSNNISNCSSNNNFDSSNNVYEDDDE